ncbi:MAG: CRISPR-associated protein Cas5 [Rubrobacteraceae bacterium]|nr:CRISPR-associated protein Cas5 [Rubrobacteraceae bacterium]
MIGSQDPRPAVIFEYTGRFGHFLRAEASASALSYPVPPRTALLGMIGAVLGLEKDTPQVELKDAMIAVSGRIPRTHWHRVKLRKDPPALLPRKVKAGAKGSSTGEKATLIKQEWLLNPAYTVTACLPEEHHEEFVLRMRERRWHYSPCMGLSEMIARLEFVAEGTARALPAGSEILCSSVARREGATLDGRRMLEASTNGEPMAILPLRMPRAVTEDRVFTHAEYLIERSGLPIPVRADEAYEVRTPRETKTVIFL